jgi:uncharacterized damage-inducible protein DinB
MNPYAKQLGEREPLGVLAETAPRLRELVARIGPDRLGQSFAPGKWDVRQTLAHLAHMEAIWATRFRFALADDNYVVQLFEQDDFMRREPSATDADAMAALEAFLALRAWNLAFLRGLTAAERARTFTHPESGQITVQDLIERLAGHDLNHLPQLEAIAASGATAGGDAR